MPIPKNLTTAEREEVEPTRRLHEKHPDGIPIWLLSYSAFCLLDKLGYTRVVGADKLARMVAPTPDPRRN